MIDGQVAALVGEAAIRRLTATYADALAGLDAERAAAVYADDGRVVIAGNETVGRDAIAAGLRRSLAAFRLLRMVAHDGIIDLDGDVARARWFTIEYAVRHGADALEVIFGRYEDALVRQADGWRFRRRVFTLAGRTRLATDKLQINPDFLSSGIFAGEV